MKRNQPFAHLFTIVFICLFVAGINSSNAQTAPITRVAVAIENNQTRIWLSDFPKKTTVVLFDDNNNLLTVISTNEFGAACTTFKKPLLNTITAKTLNGDIQVTNKALVKDEAGEAAMTTALLTKNVVKG